MEFHFRQIYCVFAVLALAPLASASIQYSVTDLGALSSDTQSYATGINNLGQVSGYSIGFDGPANHYHAWLYSNGALTRLGTLGGPQSQAFGVNDSGQVIGTSTTATSGLTRAFLYTNGSMQDLGDLGGGQTFASGVNNSGQVVGYSFDSSFNTHAFLYDSGGLHDLGTFGGNSSRANAINNFGQAVGFATYPSGRGPAFLYDGSLHDLGTLGGGNGSTGLGINDHGQVVGISGVAGESNTHAFLYSDGVMSDLGTLAGSTSPTPYSINNLGEVVGYADFRNGYRAFLYSGGNLYNLNDLIDPSLGVTIAQAQGINDSGQIATWGWVGGSASQIHAYLLTPTPEPGAVGCLGVVAVGWLLRRA
jgi:probable HAF family extracellular repeat protein